MIARHLSKVRPNPDNVRLCLGGGTAARRDGVRVFGQFAWPEVGSVKMAFSRPAHLRLTRAIGRQKDFVLY